MLPTDSKPSRRRVSLRGHAPDLAIRCGNRIFKTHQEQLVGKPGILDAVRYEGIQDGCAMVLVHDVEPTVLSCILDYFYTGDFDESGSNPYVPSVLVPDRNDGATESPFKSPSGSPSAEPNKRLAAVFTMAQKYKINELKELKVALASVDSPEVEIIDQSICNNDDGSTDDDTTKNGITKIVEDDKVKNPTNTPVVDEPLTATALSTMEALNESLQTELAALRTTYEEQTKELNGQKPFLLSLKVEKNQAERCRDSAIERLEGLMKVINETTKCKNTNCLASLNISVIENEVRLGGNVTIRCGRCNARQR
ncbi:hypothetical protein TWF970_001668 [Orbilia oligospora]|uniref:BTB domain-containing protein n=1 Tax=Orbilia oligospora TaxID=2813651 RepID=A0A7C8VRZ8_ORBOL|nr:hypothetical protein TWF970_001668 [Orbilia oligospora]